MIVVAFHYRLPTDKNSNLMGCWREFSNDRNAVSWLSERIKKTPISPQGEIVFKFIDRDNVPEHNSSWPEFDSFPVSLQKAINSYINYCNQFKESKDD